MTSVLFFLCFYYFNQDFYHTSNHLLNFITERLKFDHDLEKKKKILESLLNNFKDDKITKRLLKLNFNKKTYFKIKDYKLFIFLN